MRPPTVEEMEKALKEFFETTSYDEETKPEDYFRVTGDTNDDEEEDASE